MYKSELKNEIGTLSQSNNLYLGHVVSYRELMILIDSLDDTPTTEQAWEKIAEEYKLPVETVQQIAGTTISSAVKKEDIAIRDGCIILKPNLTEPEKPEIPKKIADKIEFERALGRTDSTIYSILQSEKITRTWGVAHKDKLMQALVNGYTVKEPIWVVKEKESGDYLVDYKLSDNDVILSSSKANAYPFKDKQQAESVATLTNNTIEERSE